RARFNDAAREIIGRGRAYPGYLNLALESAKRAQQEDLIELLVKAGAKDPSPADNPRSPERLKLLTGIYRNKAGETLTIVPALHEDELFFERAGAKRVVLLPADLTVLRSADMKTVVLLKPAVPPPAEGTLKDGD